MDWIICLASSEVIFFRYTNSRQVIVVFFFKSMFDFWFWIYFTVKLSILLTRKTKSNLIKRVYLAFDIQKILKVIYVRWNVHSAFIQWNPWNLLWLIVFCFPCQNSRFLSVNCKHCCYTWYWIIFIGKYHRTQANNINEVLVKVSVNV